MSPLDPRGDLVLRDGVLSDVGPCLALWVEACAERDGVVVPGVAERARPKFDRAESWTVATDQDGAVAGFALVMPPGSGLPTDPPGAAVLGLVAVSPDAQGRGVGSRVLGRVMTDLDRRGRALAVLHVLTGNDQAVRLYESHGWRPFGEPFPHALLGLPTQTYVLDRRS